MPLPLASAFHLRTGVSSDRLRVLDFFGDTSDVYVFVCKRFNPFNTFTRRQTLDG
jgi:hypothetical protein